MFRALFLTFWGDFRGWTVGRPSLLARARRARTTATTTARRHEHHEDLSHARATPPHESPWQMTVPLIILATFALFAGFLNPGFGILKDRPMDHWLEPVFEERRARGFAIGASADAEHMEWPLAVGGILRVRGRHGARLLDVHRARRASRRKALAEACPGLYQLLLDKWRVDELYDATVIAAVDALADTFAAVDQSIVDGILARLTSLIVAASGTVLRAFQNGVVHVYAAMMVVGLAVVGWFFVAAARRTRRSSTRATATTSSRRRPGVGLRVPLGRRRRRTSPTSPDFGSDSDVKVHLEPGKSQNGDLEVTNAFGLVRTKTIHVARPAGADVLALRATRPCRPLDNRTPPHARRARPVVRRGASSPWSLVVARSSASSPPRFFDSAVPVVVAAAVVAALVPAAARLERRGPIAAMAGLLALFVVRMWPAPRRPPDGGAARGDRLTSSRWLIGLPLAGAVAILFMPRQAHAALRGGRRCA